MNKILTIVVPCYNVEKYIRNCIESFIIEDILDDIEVLVINDGTKDSSADIAEEYAGKYPDTIRVINKENGGHGSTINRGIKEASGTYLKVIDSDDWVDKDAFVNLINCLKNTTSDIVVSNFYWIDDKTKNKKVEFDKPFDGVEYLKEYQFKDVCENMFIKMHALTIKTEILRKIPIIDEHCYYVDMEFVLFPIPFVKTVTCTDDYVYMYRVGLPGQSMNPEKMQKNAVNYDKVLNRLLDYYKEQQKENIDISTLKYFENTIARMTATRIKIFLSMPISSSIKRNVIEFEHDMKINYPGIYNAVTNKAVLMLRRSKYLLYRLAALSYRVKERFN